MNLVVSVAFAAVFAIGSALVAAASATEQDAEQERSLDALLEELNSYDERLKEIAAAEERLTFEKDLVTRAAILVNESNHERLREIEDLKSEVEAKRDDAEMIYERERNKHQELLNSYNAECLGGIPEDKLSYCLDFGDRVDEEYERVDRVWKGLQQVINEARDAAEVKIEAIERRIEEDTQLATERIHEFLENERVWEERKYAVTTLRLRALRDFLSHPIMSGIRNAAGEDCLALDTPEALHNCESAFYDEARRRGVLDDSDLPRGTPFFGIGQ